MLNADRILLRDVLPKLFIILFIKPIVNAVLIFSCIARINNSNRYLRYTTQRKSFASSRSLHSALSLRLGIRQPLIRYPRMHGRYYTSGGFKGPCHPGIQVGHMLSGKVYLFIRLQHSLV